MNTFKTITLALFASFIAVAVILSGAHAKEVASGRIVKDDGTLKTVKVSTDVAAKAVSDLHNHVDKTMIKGMVKSVSDNSVLAREREVKAGMIQLERTTSIRLIELLFMFRVAFARAF